MSDNKQFPNQPPTEFAGSHSEEKARELSDKELATVSGGALKNECLQQYNYKLCHADGCPHMKRRYTSDYNWRGYLVDLEHVYCDLKHWVWIAGEKSAKSYSAGQWNNFLYETRDHR